MAHGPISLRPYPCLLSPWISLRYGLGLILLEPPVLWGRFTWLAADSYHPLLIARNKSGLFVICLMRIAP